MVNCPSCGAPFSAEQNKCKYCGRSYFDISSIDLQTEEPFFLKLKYGDMIITQLVKVDKNNIEITVQQDTIYACEPTHNTRVMAIQDYPLITTNLSFKTVNSFSNKVLYTIDKK